MSSQDEALRRMTKFVNSLLSRSDCGPFREPVDWRGLELYDYPKIIKKMMDLGTVKRKLERGVYKTAYECAQDIRLVWNNCMTYNMEGSDFWLLAKSFSRRFEDRYKKISNEVDTGEELATDKSDGKKDVTGTPESTPGSAGGKSKGNQDTTKTTPPGGSGGTSSNATNNTITLDQKMNLGSNIFLLSGMELGHIMTKIEQKCPVALVSLGGEHVEINVDALDNRTLNELDRYVREKVGARHPTSGAANGTTTSASTATATSGSGDTRPTKKRKK
mmetsp:Transcript_11241/g.17374  ORF Transcript_11241/g.17374 Transcript_11241/m.17374 type:complete len:275 (+) Transcript_11241:190-1014(+)|eukprot:CAMPEP_0195284400 /NCGR_PEP_ID=MMETSP0707-20130614/2612_1 /TAXON_ID=33640 /ORGANISM="Asterionellopsis glacialis, Strain CCMP134" /LENGTH=274 /DNA_ID=CAMNT_0040343731 /DNA_START=157 /DNA_END=981 /DNA_ORIENTATION=+